MPGTSVCYLETDEVCARLHRTVKVSRVAETAFVEVFLEGVEHVLHASVELQFHVVAEHERVVELEVELEKVGRMHKLVLRDVALLISGGREKSKLRRGALVSVK